jgi:hypothetical protein
VNKVRPQKLNPSFRELSILKFHIMKKSIVFLSLCSTLFSMQLQGQAALLVLIFGEKLATETFHLSIDGGANYADWSFKSGEPSFGWHFGLGTHYQFADKWQLLAEFTPLNTGGAKNTPILSDIPDSLAMNLKDRTSRWNTNTIDVPVMIRYSLRPNFHLASGPIVSFLTKAEEYREAEYTSGEIITLTNDIKDQFNGVYYGWVADISYSLSESRKGKGIDLRLRYSTFFNSALANGEGNLGNFQFIATFPFIL